VKIGPATLEENRLESGNCAASLPLFDDRCLFGMLAFQKGLEYRNSDFSSLIIDHIAISFKISVSFGSVTVEFKTQEVVRLASITLPRLFQLHSLGGEAARH